MSYHGCRDPFSSRVPVTKIAFFPMRYGVTCPLKDPILIGPLSPNVNSTKFSLSSCQWIGFFPIEFFPIEFFPIQFGLNHPRKDLAVIDSFFRSELSVNTAFSWLYRIGFFPIEVGTNHRRCVDKSPLLISLMMNAFQYYDWIDFFPIQAEINFPLNDPILIRPLSPIVNMTKIYFSLSYPIGFFSIQVRVNQQIGSSCRQIYPVVIDQFFLFV